MAEIVYGRSLFRLNGERYGINLEDSVSGILVYENCCFPSKESVDLRQAFLAEGVAEIHNAAEINLWLLSGIPIRSPRRNGSGQAQEKEHCAAKLCVGNVKCDVLQVYR